MQTFFKSIHWLFDNSQNNCHNFSYEIVKYAWKITIHSDFLMLIYFKRLKKILE